MPVTKSALLRYKIIDRCLRNKYRPYPSVEDLRQYCEDELFNSTKENISRSTIEKDLKAMRTDEVLGYEAPICFDKKNKGYYYEDRNYSIQALPLNEEELQAIRFASQTLYQFRDTAFFKDFYSAIEKIFSKVEVSQKVVGRIEKIIQFENEPVDVQLDHLPLVLKAVTERLSVTFDYRKFYSKETKTHIVHPLLLKEYRSRWYLAAFNPLLKEVLIYSLDRIISITLSENKFVAPKDFDADSYFKHSLGITRFNHEKPVKVILSFHPSQSEYLKAKPIHITQKILNNNEKEFRIELHVFPSWELDMLILGYGELVRVITPDKMKKHIQKRLSAAQNRY